MKREERKERNRKLSLASHYTVTLMNGRRVEMLGIPTYDYDRMTVIDYDDHGCEINPPMPKGDTK